jgi:hypothetical protein
MYFLQTPQYFRSNLEEPEIIATSIKKESLHQMVVQTYKVFQRL